MSYFDFSVVVHESLLPSPNPSNTFEEDLYIGNRRVGFSVHVVHVSFESGDDNLPAPSTKHT
eukprot:m.187684 g.187684  ORF g.187684 m.187684 type:complete len:62 (+) comp15071_c0_seq22:1122-1307(+)